MKLQKMFLAMCILFLSAYFSSIVAQVNVTASGYKQGSSKKQIYQDNTYSFFSNEPYDLGVTIGQTSVIGRSIWYFNVPTTIPSGSQVYKVEFIYVTNNSNSFITNYISSLPTTPTFQQIWEAVDNGSNVGSFAGSSNSTFTYDVTSSLNSIIQNAVNSSTKKVIFGFKSATEVSNVSTTTFSSMSLKIYYRRAVKFTVENNFAAGSLLVNSNNRNNGDTVKTYETVTNTLQAIEPQSNGVLNYVWNDAEGPSYKSNWDWKKGISTVNKGNTQSISPTAVINDDGAKYVANLRNIYSTTFQGPGQITVNGTAYNGGTTVNVVDQNTVTATASTYFVSSDWIDYSFNNWTWSGGSSTNATITPTVNSAITYTANYTGYADASPMNFHFTSTNGNPISLAWTEHPNTNVTQYQVWRQVTGGSTSAIATLNRGTTSFTDGAYLQNPNGATKLFYAVKAYYAPSGTWNNPGYLLNRGDLDLKIAQNNDNKQLLISGKEVPAEYSISNYPNPFNPTTTIHYQLPADGIVTLKVYDILGKEVATLVNESKPAGYYKAVFDAGKLSSGMYIYTIRVNGYVQSKKMVLMK